MFPEFPENVGSSHVDLTSAKGDFAFFFLFPLPLPWYGLGYLFIF